MLPPMFTTQACREGTFYAYSHSSLFALSPASLLCTFNNHPAFSC